MALSARIRDVNIAAICFALSAFGLGHALQIYNGFFHPNALQWLTGALVFAILGVLTHRLSATLNGASALMVTVILVVGISWQIEQLWTAASPGFYVTPSANRWLFQAGVALQSVLIAAAFAKWPPIQRFWFPLFIAVSLGIGVWMIRASPNPYIDVVVVHKEAIDAFLHHRDPYRISFENIYGSDSQYFYNPAAIVGNRLAFAYPYPPPSLLLVIPGQMLFNDYRYAELALLLGAALLIGYSTRGLIPKLAACVLLTTPRVWFVIEQGWTEPVAIFLLALTVFLLVRSPVAAAWAGGLFVVTKQYLGFTGLALLRVLWMAKGRWPAVVLMLFGMAFVAAAATLPFALWHPNAFMRNVVWLQTLEPFRIDSLSYLSWAARQRMGQGTFIWAIGAAVISAVVSLAATRNTAAGFAASVMIVTFLMFAFGSKAFCNYYFFVIAALCAAIAAVPTAAAGKIGN